MTKDVCMLLFLLPRICGRPHVGKQHCMHLPGLCLVPHVPPYRSSVAATLLSPDGKVQQQLSLSSSEALSSSQLLVADAAVVTLSADGRSLCAAALEHGAARLSCQQLTSLLSTGTDASGAQLLAGSCRWHAVLQTAGGAAVLSLGGAGGAAVVNHVAGATASGCFTAENPAASPLVAFATPLAAGLATQLLFAADGKEAQPAATVAGLAPQRVGGAVVPVAALFGGAFGAGRTGQLSYHHLILFDDDSLALVADERLTWLRHEELASVQGEWAGWGGLSWQAGAVDVCLHPYLGSAYIAVLYCKVVQVLMSHTARPHLPMPPQMCCSLTSLLPPPRTRRPGWVAPVLLSCSAAVRLAAAVDTRLPAVDTRLPARRRCGKPLPPPCLAPGGFAYLPTACVPLRRWPASRGGMRRWRRRWCSSSCRPASWATW